jgi:hypothetical protein
MTIFLRQSTASQDVVIAPFVDDTDFKSPEVSLTILNTDVKLFKDGAASVDKNSGGGTHRGSGAYSFTFDATDTDTVGQLVILIDVTGALPIWIDAQVIEEAVYDIQYAAAATGQVTADVVSISGDGPAADNLEAMYDGSGYADDSAPATQSQLGGIANVGSAVHRPASNYTLTTGVQSANLYTDTEALNGTRHTHTDTGNAISLEYHFLIGDGTPSAITVTGYVTGGNDDIDVFGYDWVTAGYKQIGNIQGTSSSTNSVHSFDLFVDMVGSGADEGKVDIRFSKASGLTSATLAIDQIFVAFNEGVSGYQNASLWYDDIAANTGTTPYIDGTATNPVSTEAAIQTLLASTGLHRVTVAPGSTYTLANTHDNMLIYGDGGTLALGGQQLDETHIFDMVVSGTGTAAVEMEFNRCVIGTISVQNTHFYGCTFDGVSTLSAAGDYHVIDSQSGVAGAGSPTFALGSGTFTVEFRRWSGGVTITGITSDDVITISGELGTVVLQGVNGTVEISGTYKGITDSRTGSPTLNVDGAVSASDVAAIKAKTDSLTFTSGTDLDANIQRVNDVLVTGDGEAGTEWGP